MKLLHLVGFIIKKFDTMKHGHIMHGHTMQHGHMNVKKRLLAYQEGLRRIEVEGGIEGSRAAGDTGRVTGTWYRILEVCNTV